MGAVLGKRIEGAAVYGVRSIADGISRAQYGLAADGRRSQAALRAMREIHAGKRCFILGNGPSLAAMDLTSLRGELTIGLNRGYLLFDRLGFATTYLVAVNRLVIEQCATDLGRLDIPVFLSWHSRGFVAERSRFTFLRSQRRPGFSKDVSAGLWEGATVTYVALQLAFHMGFSQVVLIGVDHSFVTKGPAHKEVVSTGHDPNHFDPSYFGPGFRWHLPDLETSEIAYSMARRAFEAGGRDVVDATSGGRLTVFKKAPFEDLIGMASG